MGPACRSMMRLVGGYILLALGMFSLSRVGLSLWEFDRVGTAGMIPVVLQGVRIDLVVIGASLLLPGVLIPLFGTGEKGLSLIQKAAPIYFSTLLTLFFFLELSTPSFISQYDVRPNILFVEYLKYPREVFDTLWGEFRLQLVLSFVLVPAVWIGSLKLLSSSMRRVQPWSWRSGLVLALLVPLASGFAVRSSLGHRPVNPASVAFSNDTMANDLPLNSTYSLGYAVSQMRHDREGGIKYGSLPEERIVEIIRGDMHVGAADFVPGDQPTLHHVRGTERKVADSLVVILLESVGAEFVGALGGPPLTPNLDRLTREGIWFDNLYATGTRSVRGIEAVVTGFLPTSARSVVKLNGTQNNFFTFARMLKEQHFSTAFHYGGEAHFDNMRRFFMNNGFDRVVEQRDYRNPAFTGSWGVSDEDLFAEAARQIEAEQEPFFKLIFTSSNHSPFEYPDGRIEPYDAEKQTVNNAVKYTDYALGAFIERMKQSPAWDHTLFLIVSDHNSRVYGDALIPVDRFHVPALILGGGVQARRVGAVASQIDLLPTILPLLGVEGDSPAVGVDLLSPEHARCAGRAVMQFNDVQGFLEGEHLVVLRKGMQPEEFEWKDHRLVQEPVRQDLEEKAEAYALWPRLALTRGWYRAVL